MRLLFHGVIFLGSFLLFQIQPMAAKQLLPIYGGSAAVWSACMLFFQVLLLLGYSYSHAVQKCPGRYQLALHSLLLLTVILLLPATPAAAGSPGPWPVLSLLQALSLGIGPTFFILSTTSPLVQSWAVRCSLPHPYQLYTTSNIASLAALLSYPFLVEPFFSLGDQFAFWKVMFATFCLLCFSTHLATLFSRKTSRLPSSPIPDTEGNQAVTDTKTLVSWILWPAIGSILLLGFTSHICRDIAVIPFLWVLPLSIYLLSFIFCFARKTIYRRNPAAFAMLVLGVLYSIPWTGGVRAPAYLGITICSLALFCGTMIAHGELVSRKPEARHLTRFYLCMSLGGALGGVFATLAAPFLFESYFELPLTMSVLTGICLLWLQPAIRGRPLLKYSCMTAQALVLAFAIVPIFMGRSSVLYQNRNFYGVIKVREDEKTVSLTDGRIEHGNRYRDPARQQEPLGYYSPNSGIGQALQSLPTGQGRRIGVIGVGAGTVCAYAKPGDEWWLFELNPAVQKAARDYFHYLEKISGPYEFLIGDGRLQLSQSDASDFDLILLDAFSSDSVPVHLLTREAFQLYFERLKPVGLLVVHITNGHINFEPLMAAVARDLDLHVSIIHSVENTKERYAASYAVFSRETWAPVLLERSRSLSPSVDPGIRPWTDDYSNLFQLMRKPF